jgi:hypothetical protein
LAKMAAVAARKLVATARMASLHNRKEKGSNHKKWLPNCAGCWVRAGLGGGEVE